VKLIATVLACLTLICILESTEREHVFSDEDKSWWAIQPLTEPEISTHGKKWARNEIEGLVARELVRRACEFFSTPKVYRTLTLLVVLR